MKVFNFDLAKLIGNPYLQLVIDVTLIALCAVEIMQETSDLMLMLVLIAYLFGDVVDSLTEIVK